MYDVYDIPQLSLACTTEADGNVIGFAGILVKSKRQVLFFNLMVALDERLGITKVMRIQFIQ